MAISALEPRALPKEEQPTGRDEDTNLVGSDAAAAQFERLEQHPLGEEAQTRQAGQTVQTEEESTEGRLAKCTGWLKNTKTGNILAISGFMVAVVGLVWTVLSQRYSVRASKVSQCMSFYGKLQVPGCNKALEKVQSTGVPGFFNWKREALLLPFSIVDREVQAMKSPMHISLAVVISVAAVLFGAIHMRSTMQAFRPMDSLVRMLPGIIRPFIANTADNIDSDSPEDCDVQGPNEHSNDEVLLNDPEQVSLTDLDIPEDYHRFAESPWANKIILSLDAGDMRNFDTLHIMKAIMDMIAVIEEDGSEDEQTATRSQMLEYRPHHYFDYMVGSGTGGLIALVFGRLRGSITKANDLLVRLAASVLGKTRLLSGNGVLRPRYSAGRLEKVLKDVFGDRMLHEESSHACRTAVTAFGGGATRELHLLRSYDPLRPRWSRDSAQAIHPDHDCQLVLSIGYNRPTFNGKKIELASINSVEFGAGFKIHSKYEKVHRARASKKAMQLYYRFNSESHISFREWKGKNGADTSEQIENAVSRYLQSDAVLESIQECAHNLVKIRRQRARTDKWDDRLSAHAYYCPKENGEDCSLHGFSERRALRQHLLSSHAIARQIPCESFSGRIVAPWSCYLADCEELRHWGRRFDSKDQLEKHLETNHKIKDVVFMSPIGFENLVDIGRNQ